jgi:hypothetical protein
MNIQLNSLSKAIDFAIKQDWWIIVLVVVVPITFAVLLKKFEKWVKKKIKRK